MPELPEVEQIVGVIRQHALGKHLVRIDVIRWNGKYFSSPKGPTDIFPKSAEYPLISNVFRVGKYIVFVLLPSSDPSRKFDESYLIVHNAMSGYFDWEHDPWTFDYVEGPRNPTSSDVRVRFLLEGNLILRFHDARLFGSMRLSQKLPSIGKEIIRTANGYPECPMISLAEFANRIWTDRRPVKSVLMDQNFIAGIGNIYANEACHFAAINPHIPACQMQPAIIPSLLESLRCAVLHSIPQVGYHWLNVYRRSSCGSCAGPVTRTEIAKRATFHCESCQSL